MFCTILSRIIF